MIVEVFASGVLLLSFPALSDKTIFQDSISYNSIIPCRLPGLRLAGRVIGIKLVVGFSGMCEMGGTRA